MGTITQQLGRVPVPRGAFSENETYYLYNTVNYNECSYMCVVESCTGVLPTDSSSWTLMCGTPVVTQVTGDSTTKVMSQKAVTDVVGPLLELHESEVAYGIQFDTSVSSPDCTRIGSATPHKTLPVQSQIRGCLINDNGEVVRYLPDDDWNDSATDGTDGQVMVEIPAHYRKFVTDGTVRQVWLSLSPVQGYHHVPKVYVSAYQATIDRDYNMLASVKNSDARYRGGNNSTTLAAKDSQENSVLGKPASCYGRGLFRTYARNRGTAGLNGCGWNCMTYDALKTIFWLFAVEYATLNSQKEYNAELTADGYRQGGLGNGLTTLTYSRWTNFSGWAVMNCGYTDGLGNNTGSMEYTMPCMYDICVDTNDSYDNAAELYMGEYDSLTAYAQGQYVTNGDNLYKCITDTDAGTEVTDTGCFELMTRTVVSVPRYHGMENPFGHLSQWADGIIITSDTDEDGETILSVYVCSDPQLFNDSDCGEYSCLGNKVTTNGFVSSVFFGDYGDIIPTTVGGSSNTFFCDYHIAQSSSNASLCGALFGGTLSSGASAGLLYSDTHYAPTHGDAGFCSRLTFLPE